MKITVAETAGFCMGVERAVDMALKNSENGEKELYTLGPLIHNTQTIEMLEQNNVTPLPDGATSEESGTPLLVRAHGIPPQKEEEYSEKGFDLIDGTCPKVKVVHNVIKKYRKQDFSIVITGDEGHAEVIGLMGYADPEGYLIGSIEEVATLPENLDKICVVSQTTFNMIEYDEVVEAIRLRYPNAEVEAKKTICKATDDRQTEVVEVRDATEMMVVVGGRHSANTMRLAEIAGHTGKKVVHIEDTAELKADDFKGYSHVGITAGASTPGWLVQQVVDTINELCGE